MQNTTDSNNINHHNYERTINQHTNYHLCHNIIFCGNICLNEYDFSFGGHRRDNSTVTVFKFKSLKSVNI